MGEASKGPKPQVAARLPRDTYERLEDYCEEREVTKSDALRRFTEDGLSRAEIEQWSTAHMDRRVQLVGGALIYLASIVAAFAAGGGL